MSTNVFERLIKPKTRANSVRHVSAKDISKDTWTCILQYLDISDVCQMSQLNKLLYSAHSENTIWKKFVEKWNNKNNKNNNNSNSKLPNSIPDYKKYYVTKLRNIKLTKLSSIYQKYHKQSKIFQTLPDTSTIIRNLQLNITSTITNINPKCTIVNNPQFSGITFIHMRIPLDCKFTAQQLHKSGISIKITSKKLWEPITLHYNLPSPSKWQSVQYGPTDLPFFDSDIYFYQPCPCVTVTLFGEPVIRVPHKRKSPQNDEFGISGSGSGSGGGDTEDVVSSRQVAFCVIALLHDSLLFGNVNGNNGNNYDYNYKKGADNYNYKGYGHYDVNRVFINEWEKCQLSKLRLESSKIESINNWLRNCQCRIIFRNMKNIIFKQTFHELVCSSVDNNNNNNKIKDSNASDNDKCVHIGLIGGKSKEYCEREHNYPWKTELFNGTHFGIFYIDICFYDFNGEYENIIWNNSYFTACSIIVDLYNFEDQCGNYQRYGVNVTDPYLSHSLKCNIVRADSINKYFVQNLSIFLSL